MSEAGPTRRTRSDLDRQVSTLLARCDAAREDRT